MWSNFTKNNLKDLIKIKKQYVTSKSLLIIKAKKDMKNIINLPDIKYTITRIKIPVKTIENYATSFWVYDKVISEFNCLENEYLIEWDNNKIHIKCSKDKINKIKKRLDIFLKIITWIKSDSNQNIDIYLILSSLKKNIEVNKDIGPKHINSGYTHRIKKYIFIWREEEFEKVTFHELIHLYNKDHSIEVINSKYDNYESLYEAITDFKAIYYNLIYLSILTKIKLSLLFNLEITFINNQACMILNLINKNIKLISPAFSYFVLKCKIFNYFTSLEVNEEDFNDIFINLKNYNILLNKLIELNECSYYNFNSSRMSFFELI
jgi:hypothetical protein